MHVHLRQARGARADTLADHALVSLTALKRVESARQVKVLGATPDQIRPALESNGIVFLTADRGEGVMAVRAKAYRRHAGR